VLSDTVVSETFEPIYLITWCHIPGDRNFNILRGGNLISQHMILNCIPEYFPVDMETWLQTKKLHNRIGQLQNETSSFPELDMFHLQINPLN
jgi:hypothetical protein